MLQKLAHIGGNAFKRNNFTVMAGKVLARFKERGGEDVTAWYESKVEPYEAYLESLDAALWWRNQENLTLFQLFTPDGVFAGRLVCD